jgi:hypothetical protein
MHRTLRPSRSLPGAPVAAPSPPHLLRQERLSNLTSSLSPLDAFFRVDASGRVVRTPPDSEAATLRRLSLSAKSSRFSRDYVLSAWCARRLPGFFALASCIALSPDEAASVGFPLPSLSGGGNNTSESVLADPSRVELSREHVLLVDKFIGNEDGALTRGARDFSRSSHGICVSRRTCMHVVVARGLATVTSVLVLEEAELRALRSVAAAQHDASDAAAAPSRARSFSADREGFFLRAGLRLLNERAQRESAELDQYRAAHASFPAANEILKAGRMCKLRYHISKAKFAAVSPGRLFICDVLDPASELAPKPAKVVLLPRGGTGCRLVERSVLDGSSRWPFELAVPSAAAEGEPVSRVFTAASREERELWCRAIVMAASAEFNMEEMSEALLECARTHARLLATPEFIDEMHLVCAKGPLTVPVEWWVSGGASALRGRWGGAHMRGGGRIQKTLQRPRGEIDANFEQVIKDISRDLIRVNGRVSSLPGRGRACGLTPPCSPWSPRWPRQ